MGWASAGSIFDPMAKILLRLVDEKKISSEEATHLLATLSRALFDGDWDTEDESLYACNHHPVVIAAFKQAGWEPYEDE